MKKIVYLLLVATVSFACKKEKKEEAKYINILSEGTGSYNIKIYLNNKVYFQEETSGKQNKGVFVDNSEGVNIDLKTTATATAQVYQDGELVGTINATNQTKTLGVIF